MRVLVFGRLRAPRRREAERWIVREFEDRIVYGELAPGERLPTESELCELLGVSRSVVRDAVRTLVARGLVEVRQGRGMIVAAPDDHAYSVALRCCWRVRV